MKEYLISDETLELSKNKGFIPETYISIGTSWVQEVSQSIIQRWLREKHDIDITIHRSFSMSNSYHYCIIINCDYDNEITQNCMPNRNYEEALENALLKALNLI